MDERGVRTRRVVWTSRVKLTFDDKSRRRIVSCADGVWGERASVPPREAMLVARKYIRDTKQANNQSLDSLSGKVADGGNLQPDCWMMALAP